MNKTTIIIISIVAVLAVILAIYFYKKSQETTVIIQPPAGTNPNGASGIFNLVAGLGTVLGNVDWKSLFGGGNSNQQEQNNQTYCGGQARWNGTQCVPF